MAAKRAPGGEGSVYQRSSDGKWVASVTLPSGRRKVAYEHPPRRLHAQLAVAMSRRLAGGHRVTLVDAATLAVHLGCSRATVYRRIKNGDIVPVPQRRRRGTTGTAGMWFDLDNLDGVQLDDKPA